MSTLFISTIHFLVRIEFLLIGFFFFFYQSQAVIIVVMINGNKRQKSIFLKDKIYKKVLDFKEKQKYT